MFVIVQTLVRQIVWVGVGQISDILTDSKGPSVCLYLFLTCICL